MARRRSASGLGRIERRRQQRGADEHFAPEMRALDKGVLGGLLLIAIAVVWFVGGLAAGYIFYYPPVLFIIGVFGVLKGLFTGNLAGRSRPRRRKRRARSQEDDDVLQPDDDRLTRESE